MSTTPRGALLEAERSAGRSTVAGVPAPRRPLGSRPDRCRTQVRIRVAPAGEALVVSVAGEIDLGSIDALRVAVAEAVGRSRSVVVDLSGVEFLGSTGLNELVRAQRHADTRGGRLVVVSGVGNRRVLRPVHAAGLAGHLRMVENLQDAVLDQPR